MTTSAEIILRIDVLFWEAGRVSLVSRDYPSSTQWSDGSVDIENEPCTFDPPMLLYRFPTSVGDSWSSSGTCSYEDGTSEDHGSNKRATGTQRIRVDGRRYRCVVVEDEPTVVGEDAVTRCVSADLGVTVRATTVHDGAHVTTVLRALPEER